VPRRGTAAARGETPAVRGWTRRAALAGLAAAPALLTAACTSGGGDGASGAGRGRAGSGASPATVTVTPADGASAADPSAGVTVHAGGGTLSEVKVTSGGGTPVAGRFSADRTSWTTTVRLDPGTRYQVTATAASGAGKTASHRSAFSTGELFYGTYVPDAGSTVGVGMPVSITFNTAVPPEKRAAVQKAITVAAEPAVEVAGHWFDGTRLDFRPQEFWKPGTKVTLSLRLKGLELAPGRFGYQDKQVVFTIGRSQTSVVDLAAKKVTVTRDGRAVHSWPVTGGGPGHTTWAGIMVISERKMITRMNSQTVNLGGEYDIPDVPHAQRLTTSGTFIHGNYWSAPSVFGHTNASHGCVGLHDARGAHDPSTPAAEFYNSSMVGDVVKVINSGDRTVAPDNGLNGWNLSWADWKAGSAV